MQRAERLDRRPNFAAHRLFEKFDRLRAIREAQHVAHDRRSDGLTFIGLDDGLIQQRLGVAHRAFGGARDQRQGLGVDPRALGLGDRGEIGRQDGWLDAAQIEALAAREDGDRHLADFGGGEDELRVRRRLFEGLQQCVERLRGKHVHFVDHIHLVARLRGGVAHAVQQFAHLVDLGAAGGVKFEHVEVAPFDDRLAVTAFDGEVFDAGAVNAVALVVEGAGEQPGRGGLTDAAHAREHEGVGDTACRERVLQGADHGLLADQILECLRTVLARQHRVRSLVQRNLRHPRRGRPEHVARRLVTLG